MEFLLIGEAKLKIVLSESDMKKYDINGFSDSQNPQCRRAVWSILELAKKEGLKDVMIHLFGDGRDTDVHGFLEYYKLLENKINELEIGTVASVSGRYFSMDRDKNIDRTYKAYKAMVDLEGESFSDAYEYVKKEPF